MSRVPRFQEHLKTGFTAEAVSAARFRAHAERAEAEGKPELARKWRELAGEKDSLAILQLQAAGKVRDEARAIRDAISEERYENEVLYPKMIGDLEEEPARILQQVVAAQRAHIDALRELERALKAADPDG